MAFFVILALLAPFLALQLRRMLRAADGRVLSERERVWTPVMGTWLLGAPFMYASALRSGDDWWIAVLLALTVETLWGLTVGRVSVEIARKEAASAAGSPPHPFPLAFLAVFGPVAIMIAWGGSQMVWAAGPRTTFVLGPLLYPVLQVVFFLWMKSTVKKWGAPGWVLALNVVAALGVSILVVFAMISSGVA